MGILVVLTTEQHRGRGAKSVLLRKAAVLAGGALGASLDQPFTANERRRVLRAWELDLPQPTITADAPASAMPQPTELQSIRKAFRAPRYRK